MSARDAKAMRNSFAPRGGFVLAKTPSYRQLALRRRLLVVVAVAGLALASGVIGSLTAQPERADSDRPYVGPSSYFPSE
ncbi:hypothetical protein [Phenylobacterium sp. J367]|uniref:hypothetical protein n=1 Tax=Phenylobacterium sp. J367 TaxID=2898435 RepID=UPI0021511CA0|nr:hypothetical protein [Phenylobacterium sp. J367]MCR5877791.1 hypothetical protein [Phenylobacterium sp. J367]